ncbi:MAG: hypothetical protein LBT54_05335 [Bifidobacteriaceae bacterium]|nr:hypothetical protein [Bifidobacteriaceae bacterium]
MAQLTAPGAPDSCHLAFLAVHDPEAGQGQAPEVRMDDFTRRLAQFRQALPEHISHAPNSAGTRYYTQPGASADFAAWSFPHFGVGELPGDEAVFGSQVVAALVDSVQIGARVGGPDQAPAGRVRLGVLLTDHMAAAAPNGWDLRYYTGSVVSTLINDLEEYCADTGKTAFRGPNEHSLAAGAMARWELDRVPSVIVVTSGMLDEFKGTLANLREARAQGFVVCGEARLNDWFGFQGTISAEQDARQVLAARGIPHVYLDQLDRLDRDFAEAVRLYGQGAGPVVLLVTPEVLETRGEVDQPTPPEVAEARIAVPARPAGTGDGAAQLAQLIQLLESDRPRILMQCGRLSAAERALACELAETTGLALADSLTHPGSVGPYSGAGLAPVPGYLGTLGLYALSDAVWRFTCDGSHLRDLNELAFVFLKSRIGEIATPFSVSALSRKIRLAQITREPAHVAPFADIAITGEALDVLRALRNSVRVEPGVLAARKAAIRQAVEGTADPPTCLQTIPSVPATPNYFFNQLGALVGELIEQEGYCYTGVYDVGRCGISAVRNVPRTSPGFSGWYGRAAMGDALQAVPSVAMSADRNVMAFVGDGAYMIGPDIVPALLENCRAAGRGPAGNVTIFVLMNGLLSLINTYQESRMGTPGGRQVGLADVPPADGDRRLGPLVVRQRTITGFDAETIRKTLASRGTVNFLYVLLAHVNGGDGLSLMDGSTWDNRELSDLGLRLAIQRERAE